MTHCPCCSSTNTQEFIKGIEKGYDLLKCNSCLVVFANPFKEPAKEFYTNAKDVASEERHHNLTGFPQHHPANRCPQLSEGKGRKLLDLGCGNGAFIEFAEKNGFECYGLDIDQKSIEGAKTRGLKAPFEHGFINDLHDLSAFPGQYDVVTMFEVFEHIDNPVDMILKIGSILTNGGYFIGSLPNIRRFKMWQYNMDYERPPYHLTYWTTDSWKKFVEANHFQLISAENSSYFGYVSDVLRSKYRASGKLLSTFTNPFFTLTKYMLEAPIEKSLKAGASFFFVAQKVGG